MLKPDFAATAGVWEEGCRLMAVFRTKKAAAGVREEGWDEPGEIQRILNIICRIFYIIICEIYLTKKESYCIIKNIAKKQGT